MKYFKRKILLLLLFGLNVKADNLNCSVAYLALLEKYDYQSPELLMRESMKKPMELQDFVDRIDDYRTLEKCGGLDSGYKSDLQRYIGISRLEYRLEWAKKYAESGRDPSEMIATVEEAGKIWHIDKSKEIAELKKTFLQKSSEINPSCMDKDLRDTPNGHVFKKNRSQGDLSWCYAFSAADLVYFKTGINVSAVDIGFQTHKGLFGNVSKSLDDGGKVHDAIERLNKIGVCTETDLPSENTRVSVYDAYVKIISKSKNRTRGKPKKSCSLEMSVFGMVDPWDYERILNSGSKTAIEDLVNKACKVRQKVKLKVDKIYCENSPPMQNFNKWDELLNSNTPIEIMYEPDVFKNGAIDVRRGVEEPPHSSIVIARRFNKEKKVCEFLVRDTYPHPKLDEDYTAENDQSVWVNAIDLIKHTYRYTFLK